jgi:thiol-disulfide isomerase/thioredoxin
MTPVPWLLLSALTLGAAPEGVLLDFTATWCGPCQTMSPIVSKLQREGYPIRKVDVDRERALAQQYGITGIPAFVLVVNGKVVQRSVGATSEGALRSMLAKIPVPPQPPPTVLVSTPANAREGFQPAANAPAAVPVTLAAAQVEPPAKPRFSLPFISKSPRSARPREAVVRAKLDEQPPPAVVITEGDPMAASTRIRITDKSGINYGSGTIIDSRVGQTLILTCGHIFRELKAESLVEIDVFSGGRSETYVGKPVRWDLEADVGLISIPTDAPLACARMAPAGYRVLKGSAVQSVGCGGGANPSLQDLQVTALNRYRGPDTIECTGVPQQGRSGGGLFSADGRVIGVCMAADPRDSRGLYAGLKAVHDFLDQCQLSHLYRAAKEAPVAGAADTFGEPGDEADALPEAVQAATTRRPRSLEAIQEAFGDAGDAEIICVIRPKDSRTGTKVIVLNQASPELLDRLNNEAQPKTTSLKVPPASPAQPAATAPGSSVRFTAKAPLQATRVRSAAAPLADSTADAAASPKRYRRERPTAQ